MFGSWIIPESFVCLSLIDEVWVWPSWKETKEEEQIVCRVVSRCVCLRMFLPFAFHRQNISFSFLRDEWTEIMSMTTRRRLLLLIQRTLPYFSHTLAYIDRIKKAVWCVEDEAEGMRREMSRRRKKQHTHGERGEKKPRGKGKERRREAEQESSPWSLKLINHPSVSRCTAQQLIRWRLLTFFLIVQTRENIDLEESTLATNQSRKEDGRSRAATPIWPICREEWSTPILYSTHNSKRRRTHRQTDTHIHICVRTSTRTERWMLAGRASCRSTVCVINQKL